MKKILALILIVAVNFSAYNVAFADKLQDAEKNLDKASNSIESNKDKINDIAKVQQETKKQMDTFDSQITGVSNEISIMNEKIEDLNTDIASTQVDVEKLTVKILAEEALYSERIRATYKQGSTAYLNVLLGANDFSDLLSRVDMIQKIMEYDKKLMKDTNTDKSSVQLKKSELEKQKVDVVSLKKKSDLQISDLESKSSQKTTLMDSLSKDKDFYLEQQKAEEEQSIIIKNSIVKIQQEARLRAIEIRKKAEQEAAKSKQSVKTPVKSPAKSNTATPEGIVAHSGNLYCVTGKAYPVTSSYGYRIHPIFNTKKLHTGMDFGVPTGTRLYALTDGLVIYSGNMSGYGNVVMIDHGSYTSLYAHNSSLVVSVGQTVKGGQLIAYSGSTGNSTGPHLHFEIRLPNGDTTDPSSYYVR